MCKQYRKLTFVISYVHKTKTEEDKEKNILKKKKEHVLPYLSVPLECCVALLPTLS